MRAHHRQLARAALSRGLSHLQETTRAPKSFIIAGLSLVLGSLLIRAFGFGACGHTLAFLYLVYRTFHVQETGRLPDKIEMLTYWAFFGVWTLFDAVSSLLLWWVPQLETVKLFVLFFCLLPQTRGGQQMYYLVIHKNLKAHERLVDRWTDSLKDTMSNVMTEVGQFGLEFALEFAGSMGINVVQLASSGLTRLLGRAAVVSAAQTDANSPHKSPPPPPLDKKKLS